jgi:hypothetical protein
MPHDQQAVEQTKRDCRDDEQIHRRDAVGMIIEKCFPTLGRRASTPSHIVVCEQYVFQAGDRFDFGKSANGMRHNNILSHLMRRRKL